MGLIVGLVLLVVTGVVVAGAVIWKKKHSGREGREGSEFSCLTGEFQAQVEVCLHFYWAVPLLASLETGTYPFVKHMWK